MYASSQEVAGMNRRLCINKRGEKKHNDGHDGYRGGDVSFIVGRIIQDSAKLRFTMDGGAGEDAGTGQNGGAGTNIPLVSSYPSYIDNLKNAYNLASGKVTLMYRASNAPNPDVSGLIYACWCQLSCSSDA